eukprot:8573100-Ditylum_brightwellii.AAC.1
MDNTNICVIDSQPKRKIVRKQSESDKICYALLDKLCNKIFITASYTPIHLTNNITSVSEQLLDRKARSKMRATFVADLGFNFKVGVLVFEHLRSVSNWVVVWKMGQNDNKSDPTFQGFLVLTSQDLPHCISQQQTQDAINSIMFACGANCMKSRALLDCILPGSTIPTFANASMNEKQFIADTTQLILAADNKEELDPVINAR